jgi:hypothetical protein
MLVADDSQPDLDVFLVVLASVVIVWIAHTFSELVAGLLLIILKVLEK